MQPYVNDVVIHVVRHVCARQRHRMAHGQCALVARNAFIGKEVYPVGVRKNYVEHVLMFREYGIVHYYVAEYLWLVYDFEHVEVALRIGIGKRDVIFNLDIFHIAPIAVGTCYY